MTTVNVKHKTLFLNGVEVNAVEPTGNAAKDLMAAQQFLAANGINRPQQRLTLRDKVARAWRKRFF